MAIHAMSVQAILQGSKILLQQVTKLKVKSLIDLLKT